MLLKDYITGKDGYKLIPDRPVLFPVLSTMYVIATTLSKNVGVILDKQTKSTIESLVREIRTANQVLKIHEPNMARNLALCYLYLSRVVRKPAFVVSDQVRHKTGWTTTENG